MEIIEAIKITMTVFNKLIDQFPNYDQRKRQKLAEMERELDDEINATITDHALVDKLAGDIMQYLRSETKLL